MVMAVYMILGLIVCDRVIYACYSLLEHETHADCPSEHDIKFQRHSNESVKFRKSIARHNMADFKDSV